MSVVPFITDGKHQSIVTRQEEFSLEDLKVLMTNLDTNQLNEPHEANTSYDLRVGKEYLDHNEPRQMRLAEGQVITLNPGAAVIIETEEYVHFPRYRFGQILPKVGLLRVGISNTTSKIDPGYRGKLLITVFNLGKRTVKLKKGQKFCSLIIHNVLRDGVHVYDKEPKQLESNPRENKREKFKNIVTGPYWGFISFLISLLVTISIAIISIIKD
ncbi:dCTP deaminase domain-containing protein [Fictibacillus arsenicus]|uniref:Uncharacterized protein n=1 Tax=Fictibacillus arsenicus TaxID=255247 RepID=A0A1V3GAI3_9BACL|nr:hypothetical protein [Fictibacillus arsenicus]OOE13845.1 hypothetical protein UN64_01115 [Fictibacillus arsenicus]